MHSIKEGNSNGAGFSDHTILTPDDETTKVDKGLPSDDESKKVDKSPSSGDEVAEDKGSLSPLVEN